MQGPLRRKTILKDGRKPPVGAWHRYWVQLWGGALVYYHPKSLASRGLERGDFKSSPCKLQPLTSTAGKLLLFGPHQDGSSQLDLFQLSDQSSDTIYKFRAPSVTAARCWLSKLSFALQDKTSATPENLITFE
uniref:Ras-specific guanine nucleotide-releasing factor RalGPS1-like n=1 Tax=Hirondellea gigas TaxID=1518452 RepID=A0A6A7G1G9_9CRUS